MKKNNLPLGIILLVLGGISLLNNFGLTDFSFQIWKFWPLFLLIPGLMFELSYFNHNGPVGLLVPGGILTSYGILFLFCSFFGYHHLSYLWPIFTAGVGIGLYQLYYFGDRNRAIFYVSASFVGISGLTIFFNMLNLKGSFTLPIILIAVGAMMIYKPKKNRQPIITVEYEKDDE